MSNQGSRGPTRRDFLKFMGVALAATELSACSPLRLKPASQGSEPIQLVYQDFSSSWFRSMAQTLLAEFHTRHPTINVYYIPDPADQVGQMSIDMQAGTAADVFQGCCAHFPAWAQEGYTLDLRPYVAADLDQDTISDWDPAQYQALFTPAGKQFGLPK